MRHLITSITTALMLVITVGCSSSRQRAYNEGINIIPIPAELTVTDSVNKFILNKNTVIGISSTELNNPAEYLAAKLKSSTGFDVQVQEQGNIMLVLNEDLEIGDEGYTLNSTKEGVKIEAKTPQGAFYGVQTLLQLLPAEIESMTKVKGIAWEIPLVSIKDEPRFGYRGQHLDVCRHFATVEEVKRQLDILAMFKINRFHFHLTEDQAWRIEIKQYPKLTEVGSHRIEGDGSKYGPFFYTQEQIKDIVAYASKLYIDVIPEIELPGHGMAALSGYPEYSCTGGPFTPRIIWGVEADVYCVGKEETFEFLQNIITEVAELFPSKYFHIGGDECPKVRWEKCADCQARAKSLGLKEKIDEHGVKHTVEHQLQSYTVQRIEKHIASLGKHMIGWDEILEGGLAPGAIVMSWRGEEGGIAAANQDHEVIMTPLSRGMYIDFYQGAKEVEPVGIGGYVPLSLTYSCNPIPDQLPAEKHKYVLGPQANMWTEYCYDINHMEYMMYPRSLAVAEVGWSPLDRKDYKDFERRVNNACVRLDFHGINYHIPLPEGILTQNVVFIGDSAVLEFNNTRNYPMVYTLDGNEPTAKSMIYEKPIVVTKDAEVKIATILQTGKMSRVRTIPVAKQALTPAVTDMPARNQNVALEEGMKPGEGAVMRIADGLFIGEDSFEKAQFGDPVVVADFKNLNREFDMKKPSIAAIEGYVELPEDGVYTFSTDVEEFWLDGELLMRNAKLTRHNSQKVQKAMAAGKHSYKILFNNMIKDGWPTTWTEVGFRYTLPSGGEHKRVSPEMLSY